MTLRRNRRRHQRGVMAIFAGAALFFVVALALSVTEMGFNIVHSFEAHNSAEAVAMTGGLVVLSQPSPWDAAQVPVGSVVLANSRSSETSYPYPQLAPVPTQSNGPASPKDAPGVMLSQVSGPLQNFGSMLQQPVGVGATAASAVYQYEIDKLVPVLSRIVFVLDYSKSMRLYYQGYDQDSGAALTALRTAVNLAVTSQSLNNPPRVNWGLVEFAGAVDPNPVKPTYLQQSPTNYTTLTAGQLAGQVSNIQDHLAYTTGTGMTDMADAMDQARSILDDMGTVGATNPALGKGIILLISDGEPDYVPGVVSDDASTYQWRVDTAEQNVQDAVKTAWAHGYQTLTITVKTDKLPLSPSLINFMQSITGNSDGTQQPEPSNAFVATQPSDIPNWLTSINPATHCISQSKMDLTASNWMNVPGTADNIYGYYIAGSAPRYLESSVLRVSDPNNMDGTLKNNVWTAQDSFWWDAQNQIVELNVTLCMKYLQQQNANPSPAFRLRWGVPRIYSAQKMTSP